MIHAHIDTVDHRQLVGFEIGTRAQFDKRRGGDPLWVFVDSNQLKFRANESEFLRRPFRYAVDIKGNLRITDEAPIEEVQEVPPFLPGYQALKGRDGRYLKGDDGSFVYGFAIGYEPPPAGQVYLMDSDNFFLTDSDNYLLTEIRGITNTLNFTTADNSQYIAILAVGE